MLYQFFENHRAWMVPIAELASASAKFYSHPLSPLAHSPFSKRISAGLDLMHRLHKVYAKPEFGIRAVEVDGVQVAVHETVPLTLPFCRLLQFKRLTDDQLVLAKMNEQPVVLVVAPLSGHFSTLLRDTVRELLRDHRVYITDWTDARLVPTTHGAFHLDDYIRYVRQFLQHLGPDAHVIAVCQPTAPVLAAVALMASDGEKTPRTMTLMGGPIDPRRSPTAVNNLATSHSLRWFESNLIDRVPHHFPGAGRAVYPGFLQHAGFVAMNPERHMDSHYDYFLDLVRGDDESVEAHRQFYDEYNAVMDMPAEYYLDTVKTVFQDCALIRGTWQVAGKPVRPLDIVETALLTVEGELDDIAGAGQTHAAHELCTGIAVEHQSRYDVVGAGHYGIFSGRRFRQTVYPELRAFIARYDREPLSATPTRKAS